MFGYIRPQMDSLLVREARAYRAFYCGVCKRLGKQCGPLCRLFLRYDFALLAIVLDGVTEGPGLMVEAACAVNPLKRVQVAIGGAVEYAADAHGILLLGKAMDDAQDGKRSAAAGRLLLKPMVSGAVKRQKHLAAAVDRLLAAQREAERQGAGLDDTSLPFAEFMQEMFTPSFLPREYSEPLRWLGANIGRWIYLADALDDYESDKKKRRFNPLFSLGGRDEAARAVLPLMNHYAEQAMLALDVLPHAPHLPIAENILRTGLYTVAEAIARGSLDSRLPDIL